MRAYEFDEGLRDVVNWGRNVVNRSDPDAPIVMMTNPQNTGARTASGQRMRIEDFPLKTVAVSELRPWEPMIKMRDLPSRRTVASLIQTLKQGDKIPPLLVTPVRGGYRIIDGHHRYAALQRAGIEQAPVRVVDPRLIRYSDEVRKALKITLERYGDLAVKEQAGEERSGSMIMRWQQVTPSKILVQARSGDGSEELGSVQFYRYDPSSKKWTGEALHVAERYRRQGVATAMYDWFRQKFGPIRPSDAQTRDGESFWRGKRMWEQGVAEGRVIHTHLWHGSRNKHPVLEPQQAVDTGGASGSNQNAIYATSDPKVAIAMGLTTAGSDTGMFPNDPQMVLFSGKIRKGEYVYLHRLPMNGPDGKPQFVQGGNSREFHSVPGVNSIKPIEIKAVPVNKYLSLIRKATREDWALRKKFMKKQGVKEGIDPDTFEELDARIIARAAKRVVPTARARRTPEGYVHVTTEDGLDLYIGAGVADGSISVNIGSGGGVTTSGAHKGAVTEIIRGVYDAAVRKYGRPDTPGELTIDHDAGHGVWQHIADKLGLRYAAVEVKESSMAEGRISDLDIDLQDQQWEAVVGFVQDGVRRGEDPDRMSLALYQWAAGEMFDVDEELERRGFDSVRDLRDHIRDHGGQYVPPEFDLGAAGSIKDIQRLPRRRPDDVAENFADGKKPGRKGLAKRMGVPTGASVSRLRQIAKNSSGEKQRMAHWMANMKSGRKK